MRGQHYLLRVTYTLLATRLLFGRHQSWRYIWNQISNLESKRPCYNQNRFFFLVKKYNLASKQNMKCSASSKLHSRVRNNMTISPSKVLFRRCQVILRSYT